MSLIDVLAQKRSLVYRGNQSKYGKGYKDRQIEQDKFLINPVEIVVQRDVNYSIDRTAEQLE